MQVTALGTDLLLKMLDKCDHVMTCRDLALLNLGQIDPCLAADGCDRLTRHQTEPGLRLQHEELNL